VSMLKGGRNRLAVPLVRQGHTPMLTPPGLARSPQTAPKRSGGLHVWSGRRYEYVLHGRAIWVRSGRPDHRCRPLAQATDGPDTLVCEVAVIDTRSAIAKTAVTQHSRDSDSVRLRRLLGQLGRGEGG